MNPALLRHRITIQRKTITRDEYSQEVETWSDLGTYWAQVEASPGKLNTDKGTPTTSTEYKITVRYGLDIRNSDRIVYNGQTLDVSGFADKLGTRKYIEIKAS